MNAPNIENPGQAMSRADSTGRGANPAHPQGRTLLALVVSWIERSRQRRALAELDSRLLDDVGIDVADAAWEAARPFWR